MTSSSDIPSASSKTQNLQDAGQSAESNDKTLLSQPLWTPYTELSLTSVDKYYPRQVALQMASICFVIISVVMFIMNVKEQAGLLLSLKVASTMSIVGVLMIYLKYQAAKKLCYGVLEHELVVRKGLWWVATTTLPFTRLQHVSLSQNPIQRRFSLATLKCFSAGSGAAEINLPGLLFDTAEHLRQHLLHQATSLQSVISHEPQTADVRQEEKPIVAENSASNVSMSVKQDD